MSSSVISAAIIARTYAAAQPTAMRACLSAALPALIPAAMGQPPGIDLADKKRQLLDIIRRRSLLRNSDFTLASGRSSNFFFDMKRTVFDPQAAPLLADLLFDRIKDEEVDCIGGLETGAIPIVALVCARSWPEKPLMGFFVRKETKGHGTDQRIEGLLDKGARVAVFEDVTTTGASATQAAAAAQAQGCTIVKVISVVDRLEGAAANFRRAGIAFDPLFTMRDFA
jgi:orotate phosphoribosyltransferase